MSLAGRLAIVFAFTLAGFAQVPVRITRALNLRQTLRLPGNTVWRAHAAVDEGAAPPGLELDHMLLLLRRSPAQAIALRQLLAAQRTAGSPEYHRWLTPQQFGERFGPAPQDIATIEQWLQSQGFTVNSVSPGGLVIDFSGTAAAVAQALHTNIHRYQAQRPDGTVQEFWANASDPAIPVALTPVVAGVVSLNNFFSRPMAQTVVGQGSGHKPSVLDPVPELNSSTGMHALAPGDLDVIYNVDPLLTQGINGTGETIAIVARSDININNFINFRTLFQPAVPANGLQVIHATSTDPGIATNGDQIEATLDAEWAGAAAPNATIDLVVGDSSATTDGVVLAALYIVNHDLAPVMSVSFGVCEAELTASGNQFVNALAQQAAAEGITVVVSAGDNGAAGCDDATASSAKGGLAVSGFASTPYDTAVGGTQFNEGSNSGSYWNANARNADFSSALSYIPELPWDEPGQSQGSTGLNAGSGGASAVYALPFWQKAPGIAAGETARLLPDVSLNAAGGHDAFVICLDTDCQPSGANGSFSFSLVGGTSASAPSFAGMMALVDEKTGSRQGLANPVLYRLFPASPAACNASGPPADTCVFHDVTQGTNDVPCTAGTPDCPASGELGFSAAPGYDEATGLGSVNVANLVNDWSSITFAASTTALSVSLPAKATVGQSVPLTIRVTGSGSGPTPTGIVDLLAQFTDGSELAVASFNLTAGAASGSTNALPGGQYNVVAKYEGDANYGTSTSTAVSVTVGKATPTVSLQLFNAFSQLPITTLIFGDELQTFATISGPTGAATATGTVTFVMATPAPLRSAAVDPTGTASVIETFSSAPGNYQFSAQYGGDNSYAAANSTPVSLTVQASPTKITIAQGSPGQITVTLATQSQGEFPGTAPGVFNGSTQIGSVALGTPAPDPNTGFETASGTFTLPVPLGAPGTITVQFAGETGFLASTSLALAVASYALAGNTAGSVAAGQTANYTITATPFGGFNGIVTLSCSGLPTGAMCSAKPTALDGTHAASIALAIQTTAASTAVAAPGNWPTDGEWMLLLLAFGAGLLLISRRRRITRWAGAGGLALVLLTASACGGGSRPPPPPPPPAQTATPAGQYTVTVTGSASGQPAVSTTVVLNVT